MHRLSAVVIAALLVALLSPTPASALCTHPSARIWILFQGNGDCNDTIWFGSDWGLGTGGLGTYGLDTALCEHEIAPGPPPVGVCDARFVNKPGREGWPTPQGLGMGFRFDYRSGDLWRDTFRLAFQPGNLGYPVTFRWDPQRVLNSGDTVIIQDEFGGILVQARMWLTDHLVVTNPAITSLIIMRFNTVASAGPDEGPRAAFLHPAYPNPFNPSTELRFELPERAQVDLIVYDLLGRVVTRLADAAYPPGSHSIRWDAGGRAGGAYLARFTAVAERDRRTLTQTRKLLLVR